MVWHLIPEEDKRYHKLSVDCWCRPVIDKDGDQEDFFIIHNLECKLEDKILENYE